MIKHRFTSRLTVGSQNCFLVDARKFYECLWISIRAVQRYSEAYYEMLNGKSKAMYWLLWRNLCRTKKEGGLGFQDLMSFNHALLGKLSWRILQDTEFLMAKTLKARYFTNSDFLSCKSGRNSSFLWKSVLCGREIVKARLCWSVGDGKDIYVCEDN